MSEKNKKEKKQQINFKKCHRRAIMIKVHNNHVWEYNKKLQ